MGEAATPHTQPERPAPCVVQAYRYCANLQYGDDYWNADLVKDYFAIKYATDEVKPDGEIWRKAVSTSKMTKKQMTEYMERIQAYMLTEHGIKVPLPDDDKFKDFQIIYS